MRPVATACAELVAALKAAGFTQVGTDPERLTADPDAVWVQPREIRDRTLADGATLVAWVYLIAAGSTDAALDRLDAALARLLDVIDPADSDPAIDLAPGGLILPANPGTALPAYRVAVDLDL